MHERASLVPGGIESAPANRRYRVFISYSHADTKWANWLMRRLEGYRVPVRFHGRAAPIGEVGARIAPVFRDRDELPTTSDLGEAVRAALRESATLVVICSPASARSRWVQEEILAFKRRHGASGVFAFIVAGEPKVAGAEDDCFSPALRLERGADGQLSRASAEVVAADARPHADGREDAFIRLVAGLLGVGFDDLRQREQQRRHRRMTLIAASSVVGMAIALGLAATAWVKSGDARRRQAGAEDLVTFILGDLWAQLERVGRLDVLDAAGDKLIAYLESLDARDLTDTMLASHAKALTQIGRTRVNQTRYPEAARAFSAAYGRASALVGRHPQSGDMLFERGQAEYWIGFVHWKRGDLAPASAWLSRYRDSGAELLKIDAANLKWQREVVSGDHNLAVLELDRGNLATARAGFQREMEMAERMSAANPGDLQLQFRVADVGSWLGTVAERNGELTEAALRFGEQVRRLEAIVKSDPRTPRWRQRLADALGLEASVLAVSGDRRAAVARRKQVQTIFDGLAAQDAANRDWLNASLNARLKDAMLARAEGDPSTAVRLVEEARPALENLAKAEPSDRTIAGNLATAWRIEAQLLDATSRPGAVAAAAKAVEIGGALMRQNRANDSVIGEYAQAGIAAGLIARRNGDEVAAQQRWQAALAAVLPRARESKLWRLLDPAARALVLLGRKDEGRAMIEQLTRFGYQPLEAWPDASGIPTSVSNNK